jgi:1,4-alpha-glucan branching enzyme
MARRKSAAAMSEQREGEPVLSEDHVMALVQATHPDPFAVLGQHLASNGTLWQRCLLPGATEVQLLDAATGEAVVTLTQRHPEGLFEAPVTGRTARFNYRLQVRWAPGTQSCLADAFQFGTLLSEDDLQAFSEGHLARPWQALGAWPLTLGEGATAVAGVRFAVWAPHARRVSVVGDFNVWDGRRHPMRHRLGHGVWEIFVPHAAVGDHYKFEILAADGQLLPLKADPFARAAELRPATASVVAPAPVPRSLPPARAAANAANAPISIYEVHLGSWRRRADGSFHDWDSLAKLLPAHALALGFTHIELMPLGEHPFDGSWGYQTLGLYAPTARFGSAEAFQRFVATCQGQGLGVLADWVPAHFPTDAHGLASFDGSALYEYADPREGFHRDWNTLIYNYSRPEVRNFLSGNALYWTDVYGVDGLRVDAVASMLYRDYSRPDGEWLANVHGGRENLEAITLLEQTNELLRTQAPGAITLAEESTAFPRVSAPVAQGGLGFNFKWNLGWMHDTLAFLREDPIHRRWHHHKMSFGLVYAFTENFVLPLSHDEVVHGKGSLLNKMHGDEWQKFAHLRAYYGFMWGHPGKKLLFMGQEFAQPTEWNHDAELPWELLDEPRHAGVMQLVRDLNQLYRSEPALHQLDNSPEGFEWLAKDETELSVIAWLRKDQQGQAILMVSNFTPVPRHDWRLGVPAEMAAWREVLNTDAAEYGGSGVGNASVALPVEAVPAHQRAQSISLTLPPLATVFLRPV